MINGVKYNSLIKMGSGFFSGYRGKVIGYEIPSQARYESFRPMLFRVNLRENYGGGGTSRYDWCQTVVVHITDIESVITEEEMNLLERPLEDPNEESRRRREREHERMLINAQRQVRGARRNPYGEGLHPQLTDRGNVGNVYITEPTLQGNTFNYQIADDDTIGITATARQRTGT